MKVHEKFSYFLVNKKHLENDDAEAPVLRGSDRLLVWRSTPEQLTLWSRGKHSELCHVQAALTSRHQRLLTLNTCDSLPTGVVLAWGRTWPSFRVRRTCQTIRASGSSLPPMMMEIWGIHNPFQHLEGNLDVFYPASQTFQRNCASVALSGSQLSKVHFKQFFSPFCYFFIALTASQWRTYVHILAWTWLGLCI